MAWDQYSWKRVQSDQMVAFQRMVGGVGMGAISVPIWNFINFDPRTNPPMTLPYGLSQADTLTVQTGLQRSPTLRRYRSINL